MFWIIKALKNTFKYKGRARRKEYLYFLLLTITLYIYSAIFLWQNANTTAEQVFLAYLVPFCLSTPTLLSLTVRRLHDQGITGKFTPFLILPFFFLVFIPFSLLRGESTKNKYGHHPKGKRTRMRPTI